MPANQSTKNKKNLKCTSCNETFNCAHSLLEHAQFVHKFNIFTNNDFSTTAINSVTHQNREQAITEHLPEQIDENQMVTPKNELFVDVSTSASNESTEKSAKNRSTSLSLSVTSPTMSTTSSTSSQFQTSFKSPADSESNNYNCNSIENLVEPSTPKHRCNSISFDFRDSNLKPQTNKNHFRRGSQVQLPDPNQRSPAYSIESNGGGGQINNQNTNYYSMQNSYNHKLVIKAGRK